jgi:hypothetical protein
VKAAALLGVLSGGLASLLVLAPNAHALPDNVFCSQLAAVGYAAPCPALVALAKDVCAQYDRGANLSSVIGLVDARTKDTGLSNYIIAGAPMYFCPTHQNMTP